jgi:hypothetical protein
VGQAAQSTPARVAPSSRVHPNNGWQPQAKLGDGSSRHLTKYLAAGFTRGSPHAACPPFLWRICRACGRRHFPYPASCLAALSLRGPSLVSLCETLGRGNLTLRHSCARRNPVFFTLNAARSTLPFWSLRARSSVLPAAAPEGRRRKYRESSIRNRVSSIQHRASRIEYRASGIRHPASSIKHQASSIKNRVSSILALTSNNSHFFVFLIFSINTPHLCFAITLDRGGGDLVYRLIFGADCAQGR